MFDVTEKLAALFAVLVGALAIGMVLFYFMHISYIHAIERHHESKARVIRIKADALDCGGVE